MNRLLSILVALFILFMLYLWINHITRDPWESTQDEIPAQDVITDESVSDDTTFDYTSTEKTPTEGSTQGEELSPESEQADAASTHESPLVSEERSSDTQPRDDLATQAQHLVIAGNFLERSNADARAKELRAYGFENAEVVNFQLSEYHTVCAGRFSDPQEARRVARKIKDNYNIDAYVRHGN